MPTVIGAQFKPVTKIYFFDPEQHLDLAPNDYVIVDTVKGRDLVQIVQAPAPRPDDEIVGDIKRVVRRATPWDLLQKELWKEKQTEAVSVCREKARTHGLDIKVLRCEYNYEGGRLTVFFASEQRVDFRALVRDLARTFHTRIEMRQIGVRDEAKLLDGVGKCGASSVAPVGCASSLRSASARRRISSCRSTRTRSAAFAAGFSVAFPTKTRSTRRPTRRMPKVGAEVTTHQGKGRVRHLHPLKESVTVLLENNVMAEFQLSELIAGEEGKGRRLRHLRRLHCQTPRSGPDKTNNSKGR